MKVLLDENLPQRLRHYLPGHDVLTVGYLGWSGLENGELLAAVQIQGIEALVTADRNLSYQQNLSHRTTAIVLLSDNHWKILKNHLAGIRAAVDQATSGSFIRVDCGKFFSRV